MSATKIETVPLLFYKSGCSDRAICRKCRAGMPVCLLSDSSPHYLTVFYYGIVLAMRVPSQPRTPIPGPLFAPTVVGVVLAACLRCFIHLRLSTSLYLSSQDFLKLLMQSADSQPRGHGHLRSVNSLPEICLPEIQVVGFLREHFTANAGTTPPRMLADSHML